VVASRALFGACHAILTKILPKWGVITDLIDGRDLAAWQDALKTPAKLVFLESPSNPVLELVDIAAVSELAHAAGAQVMVDNVFASPLYQKPFELGADIVIYSTTKHIDGQGRLLGGAVLGKAAFVEEVFLPFYRQTGAAISAFNAWVMLKSLETLPLRVAAQTRNAAAVVDFLVAHPKVRAVSYPGHESHPQHELAKAQMSGYGNMLAFEIDGGQAEAFQFLNALELIDISNNLGDSKSLACHPFTTTHANLSDADRASLNITEGHIRLSVGLEDSHDLIADLDQALAAVR
jgi:O-succinylhomoserine sulfhydrylase